MRDRAADIAYRGRQARKGLRQLSVWVPTELQALLVELASYARVLPVDQPNPETKCLASLIIEVKRLIEAYRPSMAERQGD